MATPRSTMSAGARPIHPAIVKATISAAAAEAEARAAAEYLAEVMQSIHGGSWRIDIDHEVRFIMIRDLRDDRRVTPKPEVA